jgi:hypothetical protein
MRIHNLRRAIDEVYSRTALVPSAFIVHPLLLYDLARETGAAKEFIDLNYDSLLGMKVGSNPFIPEDTIVFTDRSGHILGIINNVGKE